MPRLRPRMTSRRGSSRGQVIKPPASPSSASSSDFSDPEEGRAAPSRRGRGRGRGSNPSTSAAQVRLSFNAHFHSVCFMYPCSLNHHEYIAYVSIKLRTNPIAQVLPSAPNTTAQVLPSGIVPASEDEILFCPPGVSMQSVQGAIASQFELQQAGPSAPSGSGFSGKAPPPPADDDFNPYACPVVEEAPSPTNEA